MKVADEAGEVGGIGLTGQMHGSVFLDASDQVIRPALLWNDQRTQAQCEEITHSVGAGTTYLHRRQPGPHRLPGAEDRLAERRRAGELREDLARPPPQGLRKAQAHGRVRNGLL